MSTITEIPVDVPTAHVPRSSFSPKRITMVRAVVALIWAAALTLALGGGVPTTDSDVPVLVALLLATYPLIDIAASLTQTALGKGSPQRVLRINATIGAAAVAALTITAFGADAGAALAVFGTWAFASGAIQLGMALHRRQAGRGSLPMIISGTLSTIAGLTFIASSRMDDAHLGNLAGYAALGAVLYLLSARGTHG